MKSISLPDLRFVDFNVYGIIALKQRWPNGSRFSYRGIGRPDHGFHLVTRGKILYTDASGRTVEATKGDVVYLPQGGEYEAAFFAEGEKPASCLLVNFRWEDETGEPLALSEEICDLCRDTEGELQPLFRSLTGAYRASGDKLRLKALFFDLLEKIAVSTGETGLNVSRCGDYIRRNLTALPSVPRLAALCRVSETTFRKRFREIYGESPTRYITRRKLDMACQLLQSSDITTEEIVALLGFYDTSYFYKVMKAYLNTTPAAYRDRCRRQKEEGS